MDGQKVERNGNWKERAYACTSARACVCVRARARVRVDVSTRAERADAYISVRTVRCYVREVDGQIEWMVR